ncbi:MAG: histidine phosphatase family protein [Alphaproteobacteria bacterium]|nr:histidine phosphatase family protein [Alphaproteobacteria bacterium]
MTSAAAAIDIDHGPSAAERLAPTLSMAPLEPGVVLLVRHGESVGNASAVYSGSSDHPLTEAGRSQAHDAGLRLAASFPAARLAGVFTSRLSRARETAALLLSAWRPEHPEPVADPALDERHFGEVEGMSHGHPLAKRAMRDPTFAPPRGESLEQALRRAAVAFDARVAPLARSGPVLVVGHGAVLRCLIVRALGWPLASVGQFTLDNCQITRLRVS